MWNIYARNTLIYSQQEKETPTDPQQKYKQVINTSPMGGRSGK